MSYSLTIVRTWIREESRRESVLVKEEFKQLRHCMELDKHAVQSKSSAQAIKLQFYVNFIYLQN